MDTQDKRTNNIFVQSILPISFFNGYTGQTVKQHSHSKYSTHVFLNGHTGQTVKQHINLKHSTHVFIEWTHRTNNQTIYLFKVFYPCLFLMDTQDKRTNNVLIQSILPKCFYNGHTGHTIKQYIYSKYSTHVFS